MANLYALVGANVSEVACDIGLNGRIGRTYSPWGSAVAGLASRGMIDERATRMVEEDGGLGPGGGEGGG